MKTKKTFGPWLPPLLLILALSTSAVSADPYYLWVRDRWGRVTFYGPYYRVDPIQASGERYNRSLQTQHTEVGRYRWGVQTQAENRKGYEHRSTRSTFYEDSRLQTDSYYQTPDGSGTSQKYENEGSRRQYSHGGDPERIREMNQIEADLSRRRTQAGLAEAERESQDIDERLNRQENFLIAHRSRLIAEGKLTPSEYEGFMDSIRRCRNENERLRAQTNEIRDSLRSGR